MESVEKMIEQNIRFNNEFYISLSYNFLINNGLKIGIHEIELNENWPTGTTADIKRFIEKYPYENI